MGAARLAYLCNTNCGYARHHTKLAGSTESLGAQRQVWHQHRTHGRCPHETEQPLPAVLWQNSRLLMAGVRNNCS